MPSIFSRAPLVRVLRLLVVVLLPELGQCFDVKKTEPMQHHSRKGVGAVPVYQYSSRSAVVGPATTAATILGTTPRRLFFQQSACICFVSILSWSSTRQPARAADVRGPVELLRPATRVRLYIAQAVDLCREIQKQRSGNLVVDDLATTSTSVSLDALTNFFEHEPTSFMTMEETKLSQRFMEIDTSSGWQSARLREREQRGAEIGVDYTTPYDKFNTAIQQWGDKTQFRILRSRQRSLEKSNSIRAALNAYTNNLVFGNSYRLNVQGTERKNLVRSNALPDVNAVVVSDLDLRDLYRNQILENMDDAKAELVYQQRRQDSGQSPDVGEILTYLLAAQEASDTWFGFIPKDDVQQALEDVKVEPVFQKS